MSWQIGELEEGSLGHGPNFFELKVAAGSWCLVQAHSIVAKMSTAASSQSTKPKRKACQNRCDPIQELGEEVDSQKKTVKCKHCQAIRGVIYRLKHHLACT